jgi:uncharacterized protein (TIGR02996 family)
VAHDEAFLRAILADPDDDGPRLIYADWLEERGDVRSEFIRLQCMLARLAAHDPRRPVLEARERSLLAEHEESWAGPLQPPLVHRCVFERGFVGWAVLDAQPFLQHAEELFRLAPLRGVWLRKVKGLVPALAHCRALRSLALLDLMRNGLDYPGLRRLAASRHLAGLKTLILRGNRVGSLGAKALASSAHLAGLTSLDVSNNRIGPTGADDLAGSPHLGGLSVLDLRENPLGDRGRHAVREAFGDRVRV